ncbi:MAG: PLAT/LH2 domain-containing protein [Bacteroidota bacterium]
MKFLQFSLYPSLLALSLICLAASCGNGNNSGGGSSSSSSEDDYSSGPEKYRVVMRTGCEDNAGTDAKMYIQLRGKKGDSKPFLLENPMGDEFVACSRDVFEIKPDKDLGQVTGLFLWHDNTGEDPSYKVEIIDVTYLKTGKKQGFPCGKWFATDIGDGQLKREFFDFRECK